LHNLASGKVNVGTYLVVVALVVLMFALVMLGLFYTEAQPYLAIIASGAKSLLLAIWNSAFVRFIMFWRKREN
jgi:membrane protein YdbS with pleckstrin-like domain